MIKMEYNTEKENEHTLAGKKKKKEDDDRFWQNEWSRNNNKN